MEARRGRDSRSEARCAARQRDRPCFLAGDARLSYDPSMEETIINNDDRLEHMLHRSNALHERLDELLGDADFDGSPRGESALGMCLVAMEHATAMRALMALRLPSSAVGLMRLQFEALTVGNVAALRSQRRSDRQAAGATDAAERTGGQELAWRQRND